MSPHTLVTQIVPTLWTEVLGFSVEVIFYTFSATKVIDQIGSFMNGGSAKSHFLISCLPLKTNNYQYYPHHKIKTINEDTDKMSPYQSVL